MKKSIFVSLFVALMAVTCVGTTGCSNLSAFAVDTCELAVGGSKASSLCVDLEEFLADPAEEVPAE